MDENVENSSDVSFGFDKYNKPQQLSLKESVANAITNALFLRPGNNPTMPTVGPDIRQYFYKFEDELDSYAISNSIKAACGNLPGGAKVDAVDFSVQPMTDGITVFLILVKISFNANDTSILGISMKEQDDKVSFNFDYVDL